MFVNSSPMFNNVSPYGVQAPMVPQQQAFALATPQASFAQASSLPQASMFPQAPLNYGGGYNGIMGMLQQCMSMIQSMLGGLGMNFGGGSNLAQAGAFGGNSFANAASLGGLGGGGFAQAGNLGGLGGFAQAGNFGGAGTAFGGYNNIATAGSLGGLNYANAYSGPSKIVGGPAYDSSSIIVGGPQYHGGKKGDFWGDPHFNDFDGGKFDVMGENGKMYNILSDQNIQYNAKFEQWGNDAGATIIGEAGIKVGNDAVRFDKTGAASVNGMALQEGETVQLQGGTAALKDGKLNISTNEYDINLKIGKSDQGNYIDSDVSIKDAGPFSDYVAPHGILGQTADGDGKARNGKQGKGAQGEGAIDGVYTDYEVSDLFADDFKFNRYGAQIAGAQRGANGEVEQVFDINGNVIYKKPVAPVGKEAKAN